MSRDVEDPNEAWEKGYDQAAREVLEEVSRYDLRLYVTLLSKYPGWRKVMSKAVPLVPSGRQR